MAQAAACLDYPHILIKTDLAAGAGGPAQAHICRDTVCFPPVREPADLAAAVAEALQGAPGSIENIFERFAGV